MSDPTVNIVPNSAGPQSPLSNTALDLDEIESTARRTQALELAIRYEDALNGDQATDVSKLVSNAQKIHDYINENVAHPE